jgi:hypothetical protein
VQRQVDPCTLSHAQIVNTALSLEAENTHSLAKCEETRIGMIAALSSRRPAGGDLTNSMFGAHKQPVKPNRARSSCYLPYGLTPRLWSSKTSISWTKLVCGITVSSTSSPHQEVPVDSRNQRYVSRYEARGAIRYLRLFHGTLRSYSSRSLAGRQASSQRRNLTGHACLSR